MLRGKYKAVVGYGWYFIKLGKILYESVILFSHLVYLAYCLFKRSREGNGRHPAVLSVKGHGD